MVIWTTHASHQLKDIYAYISNDSVLYAKRMVVDILRRAESINDLPRLGRVLAELNQDFIREIPVYSYRLIYQIHNHDIYILAIVHKRKQLTNFDLES